MNNKDLEKAIKELQGLEYVAQKALVRAENWKRSPEGDNAQKEYESYKRQAEAIYQQWATVAKLAEKYGDLPTEMLFNLYAYDYSKERMEYFMEIGAKLLDEDEFSRWDEEEPIRYIDEQVYEINQFLRELEPKVNKCLKLVEYVGLEWYDAFIAYMGKSFNVSWIGRNTSMRIIPHSLVHGNVYREIEIDEPMYSPALFDQDSPIAMYKTKETVFEFEKYAIVDKAAYRILLIPSGNKIMVVDSKTE